MNGKDGIHRALILIVAVALVASGPRAVAGPDTDGDGVPNVEDNCPLHSNQEQRDSDGNGYGDACQTDRAYELTMAPCQIDNNAFSDDEWSIRGIDLRHGGEYPTLTRGEALTVTFSFDQWLELQDNVFDEDEAIEFFLKGVGGVGGGLCHELIWKWDFLDIDPMSDPIVGGPVRSGIGTLIGISGNANSKPSAPCLGGCCGNCSVCLCNDCPQESQIIDGTTRIQGIRLTLAVPPASAAGPWTPGTIRLSVFVEEIALVPKASHSRDGKRTSAGPACVPTLSQWGLIGLALVLLTAGTIVLRGRQRVAIR